MANGLIDFLMALQVQLIITNSVSATYSDHQMKALSYLLHPYSVMVSQRPGWLCNSHPKAGACAYKQDTAQHWTNITTWYLDINCVFQWGSIGSVLISSSLTLLEENKVITEDVKAREKANNRKGRVH